MQFMIIADWNSIQSILIVVLAQHVKHVFGVPEWLSVCLLVLCQLAHIYKLINRLSMHYIDALYGMYWLYDMEKSIQASVCVCLTGYTI